MSFVLLFLSWFSFSVVVCQYIYREVEAEIKSRYKFGSEVALERKLVGKVIEERRLPRRGDSYQEKVNKQTQ
eukprot:snap_masked-scaffold_3-processed-gene-2.15-mRNA-1 protein AED:1.00 eAED:1.00 QI:0/0/0/0/1/1/2/0/71